MGGRPEVGLRLRRAGAPLSLARARWRRRPGRWLLPVLGIAIATAFVCAVAGQASVAGDRAARSTLATSAPTGAAVKVSAPAIGGVAALRVRALLSGAGLGPITRVTLLVPLRLGGSVVQLAAITPLSRWTDQASAPTSTCVALRCPLLLAGGAIRRPNLAIAGAGLRLAGHTRLTSSLPLGFRPLAAPALTGQPPPPPLLLSGDVDGLANLPGLQSTYRTTTWLARLDTGHLHSWQLGPLERRLQRDQADLGAVDASLTVSAPFDALDAARAHADAAPRRLLLAGGGAAAVMAAFVLLAAGALRSDMSRELARLQTAGSTRGQRLLLAASDAAGVSALGVLVGFATGLLLVTALAAHAGEPAAEILAHSLLTVGAAVALVGGWTVMSLVLTVVMLLGVDSARHPPAVLGDVFAVAAAGTLALALARGGSSASSDPLPVLVAPLCCLAAGALVYRLTAILLRGGERASRRAPLSLRLALVNLARAPGAASAAAAFVTVSVALGAFALSYRATVSRSVSDQASSQVPLDVTVSSGPSFAAPLLVAPLARWRAIGGGAVLPVRRTQASFPSGASTATVPVVALPARGLPLLHGWRSGDASLGRAVLAARLIPSGPVRGAGPLLPPATRRLIVTTSATSIAVGVAAVLRDQGGAVITQPLGVSLSAAHVLGAGLAGGGHRELEALTLTQSAGLTATTGHQGAENPSAPTRLRATVVISSVRALDGRGRPLGRLRLSDWRALGAAGNARARGGGVAFDFESGGQMGVLRPRQPGDSAALPVLVDPGTAAQAGHDARLALTVDGVAIPARVVGRLRRFPTVNRDAGGFVVADEGALASRLDGQMPGQGRADELWLSAPRLDRARTALQDPRLAALNVSYRADIEHGLRADAVLRGVSLTLAIAALTATVLAAVGMLITLGSARDRQIEHDLTGQGMGPRSLRLDLRLRLSLIAVLGLGAGLATGLALSRLSVAAVGGSVNAGQFSVPLVTVVPWPELALFVLATAATLGAAAWAASARQTGVQTR